MVYYCSEDCQRMQWKAGHKKACRMRGQIENGDVMRVEGLVSRTDLNGSLVKVIGPIIDKSNSTSGRWKVRCIEVMEGGPCISVSKDNLFRIRPSA